LPDYTKNKTAKTMAYDLKQLLLTSTDIMKLTNIDMKGEKT